MHQSASKDQKYKLLKLHKYCKKAGGILITTVTIVHSRIRTDWCRRRCGDGHPWWCERDGATRHELPMLSK